MIYQTETKTLSFLFSHPFWSYSKRSSKKKNPYEHWAKTNHATSVFAWPEVIQLLQVLFTLSQN